MEYLSLARQALLIEADPFLQLAVTNFLSELGYKVSTAATIEEASIGLSAMRPDLIVMDATIPKHQTDSASYYTMPGLQLLQEVKINNPQVGIVIWSAYVSKAFPSVSDLIRSGYTGIACLPKGSSIADFHEAIERAVNGYIFISKQNSVAHYPASDQLILNTLPGEITDAVEYVANRLSQLAPQERAVVQNLTKENRIIARELGISERTVAHYMDNIYTKLGFKNPQNSLQVYRRQLLIVLAMIITHLRNDS